MKKQVDKKMIIMLFFIVVNLFKVNLTNILPFFIFRVNYKAKFVIIFWRRCLWK